MTIDKKEFEAMRKELSTFDAKRETLIHDSRQLLTLAKKAMYNTHRDKIEKAEADLKKARPLAEALRKEVDKQRRIGAINAALQEWAEALSYQTYITEQRLITKAETGLETEDYLLALSDLSGELTRRAVLASIKKDSKQVHTIREFVDELLGEFLSFDFRNGELRKKTDQIRWNLQKIEELLVRIS